MAKEIAGSKVDLKGTIQSLPKWFLGAFLLLVGLLMVLSYWNHEPFFRWGEIEAGFGGGSTAAIKKLEERLAPLEEQVKNLKNLDQSMQNLNLETREQISVGDGQTARRIQVAELKIQILELDLDRKFQRNELAGVRTRIEEIEDWLDDKQAELANNPNDESLRDSIENQRQRKREHKESEGKLETAAGDLREKIRDLKVKLQTIETD